MKPIDYRFLCIFLLLLAAIKEDLKSYKIPNRLIVAGLVVSLILVSPDQGWTSIFGWIQGILLPVIFLFPLFIIRALGAGDIKLYSVIGGFYGITFCIQSILFSFLAAAIFSVFHIILKKQIHIKFKLLVNYVQRIYWSSRFKEKEKDWYRYYNSEEDKKKVGVHFSVYILIGVIVTMGIKRLFPEFSLKSLLL
ncbi:MAG: Flp pilus assembly protein protease CpaA [Anaerocolumna sp.]|nr:Flp pilus assembly protein protease CpaA [Anaerocolumna sp.]